ncbi:hypothetical protein QTP88_005177 [Uroleucon formosanum]
MESIPHPPTINPDTTSRTTESRRRADGLQDNTVGEEIGIYNHVRPDPNATTRKKTGDQAMTSKKRRDMARMTKFLANKRDKVECKREDETSIKHFGIWASGQQ